jgi:hypothetical protein
MQQPKAEYSLRHLKQPLSDPIPGRKTRGSTFGDHFARLLDKPVTLVKTAEVSAWNPAVEHEAPPTATRYRELLKQINSLDEEEMEEFEELAEIFAVENMPNEVEGRHCISFRLPHREWVVTARTKEKLIHRVLCFLGDVSSTATFLVECKLMNKSELRKFIENL